MKAAEEMTREELIAYDKWLTRRKWGTGEIISPEKAADLYLAEHPLPPAGGAEETAQRCPVCGGNGLVTNGFYNQTSGYWSTSSISPETCRTCNGTGVILPSYLHAQQIADKMVSERLNNAPKNCPKAAQCAHVEGGMKCPPNIICPI